MTIFDGVAMKPVLSPTMQGVLSVVTLVAALCAGYFFFYRDADAAYYRVTTDVETEGRVVRLDVVVRCGSLTVMRSIGGMGCLLRAVRYGGGDRAIRSAAGGVSASCSAG